MGSQTLDILRQGIWASLTGGWYYDPYKNILCNTFHLYIWLLLFCFPLVIYFYINIVSIYIWTGYVLVVSTIIGVIKIMNLKLHQLFDTTECILEDNTSGGALSATSGMTNNSRFLQALNSNDTNNNSAGRSVNEIPEVIELEDLKSPEDAGEGDESLQYSESSKTAVPGGTSANYKVDVHRKNSTSNDEASGEEFKGTLSENHQHHSETSIRKENGGKDEEDGMEKVSPGTSEEFEACSGVTGVKGKGRHKTGGVDTDRALRKKGEQRSNSIDVFFSNQQKREEAEEYLKTIPSNSTTSSAFELSNRPERTLTGQGKGLVFWNNNANQWRNHVENPDPGVQPSTSSSGNIHKKDLPRDFSSFHSSASGSGVNKHNKRLNKTSGGSEIVVYPIVEKNEATTGGRFHVHRVDNEFDNEDNEEEEEEEKEFSTEHDESMEGTTSAERGDESVTGEMEDKEEAEKIETESEDRVKLVERNNDEKASLLKEELLKKCEKLFAGVDQLPEEEQETEPAIPLASEDIQPMALSLDERLENLNIRVVIKECVRTSCSICVYCYHATRIIVNGKQLALHILAEHRYTPVKNDTSDDLIQFIKNNLNELENEFFSSETFDPTDKECFKPFDNVYYCLQCAFTSKHQRELTSHKRKMHPKTSQICLLCKQIFLNQSELLFHYCAGENNPNPQANIYWCGICGLDKIPSTFRLMVHLRKKHNTCNVCLEACANEGKLLQHMLKHKIIHMCYKCNISYRNKQDITKHLFWKHGTESIVCKKCLQKRWSHVYHFCQPPARFTCDECNLMFKKSVSLKVHKRLHQGIYPYECSEEGCSEKFISQKLLEKHSQWHREPPKPITPPPETKNESQSSEPHIDVCNVDDGPNPVQDLKTSSKKKKKKSKFDLNNMNLPPLNLSESESDSSDDDGPSGSPTTVKDTPLFAEEAPTKLSETPTESAALEADTGDSVKTDVPQPLSEDKPAGVTTSLSVTDEPKTEDGLDTDLISKSDNPVGPPSTVDMPDLTAELSKPSTGDPVESISTKEPQTSLPPLEDETLKTSLPPVVKEPLKTSLPPVEEEPLKTSVPPEEELLKASLPPVEEPPPVPDIVPDVWDQFKSFTQSLNVYRHVEEEHDYHVVYERTQEEEKPQEVASIPNTDGGHDGSLRENETGVEKTTAQEDGEQDKPHDHSIDTTLNKTTSDDNDSSSDSSSSSSCGSQCGSNCSCSSSSSSSSSSSDDSSSDSDSSDPDNRKKQEEKRAAKKARKKVKKHASHNTSDEVNVTIENSPRQTGGSPERDIDVDGSHHEVIPPPLPPPINESDLETDVSSSDEEFYDENPQLSAPNAAAVPKLDETPPQSQSPSSTAMPLPVPSIPSPPADIHYPQPYSHSVIPTTPSRTPKKRKRPRMRNVPTSTPKASAPAFKTSFKHPFMRPSPAFETKKPMQPLMMSSTPTRAPDTLTDDNTRSSKRKRKQNRFYGYSDDEDDNVDYDNDESEEFSLVKHPPLKKKLLWKPPLSMSFNDKIPALPPASPPPPSYDNKIRFENPFRKMSTDYEAPSADYGSAPSVSSPAPSSSSSDSEDPVAPPRNYSPPPVTAPVPLYCYCRCPYDEVSEMIACDGDDCEIEWYHFECVNILVPPKGKWYCPQCRPKYQPF
uniref:Pecanex-like protein n=2 Tax=Cacopsylla melanoneura TaxID=428564 RepID=A0A8D8SV58_9HEMI